VFQKIQYNNSSNGGFMFPEYDTFDKRNVNKLSILKANGILGTGIS
jgi:hypothetical protein